MKKLVILLLLALLIAACNKEEKSLNNNKIEFGKNLKVTDERFLNVIEEYTKMVKMKNRLSKNIIYLVYFENASYDTLNFIIGYSQYRNFLIEDIKLFPPIANFIYKGNRFFFFSTMSRFCKPDTDLINSFGKIDTLLDEYQPTIGYRQYWKVKITNNEIIKKNTQPENFLDLVPKRR